MNLTMKFEIRDVVLDDAELLFEWANDSLTRANSFNSDRINWNSHLVWLQRILKDACGKFYLFLHENEPVGIVRFDLSEETIIGVTVAPEYRGKNVGSEIIKMACTKFHESNEADVLAYIKTGNIASQKSFIKAGFVFLRNEIFKNEECIILIAKKNVVG
jgi:RimJ/RimL family protein N-acetyltransferase